MGPDGTSSVADSASSSDESDGAPNALPTINVSRRFFVGNDAPRQWDIMDTVVHDAALAMKIKPHRSVLQRPIARLLLRPPFG
jgi:hypothetical protein